MSVNRRRSALARRGLGFLLLVLGTHAVVGCEGHLIQHASCRSSGGSGGSEAVDSGRSSGDSGSGAGGTEASTDSGSFAGTAGNGGAPTDGGVAPDGGARLDSGTTNDARAESGAGGAGSGAGDASSGGASPDASSRSLLGGPCGTDSDCEAAAPGCDATLGGCACDAASHRCVTSHCRDHRRDSTESDVDCGGLCAGCGPGKGCVADTDCSVFVVGCDRCTCDRDTLTCVHDHCLDHAKDVDETDVDCGGSCSACGLTASCRVDADCASNACDLDTLRCVADQCADHRKDGKETDADCGGGVCAVCGPGKKCLSNFDCVGGHFCNGTRDCQ